MKRDDDSVLEGELLEGRYGEDVTIRVPMGTTVIVPWSSLRWIEFGGHKVAAQSDEARALDLPWLGRPTFAAHTGLAFFTSDTFGPYVGGGFVYGGSVGWSFSRTLAAALVYEHAAFGNGDRNGGTSSPSNAIAVVARLRTNRATGGVAPFAQLGFGVRWLSYRFSANDFALDDSFSRYAPPSERASLFGLEVRIAAGFGITLTRALSLDIFYSGAPGRFVRYSDTLDCNTFRPGPCGGGYNFTYGQHGLVAEVSWN